MSFASRTEISEQEAVSAFASLLDLGDDEAAPKRPSKVEDSAKPSKPVQVSSDDSASGDADELLDEAPDDDLVSQEDEGDTDPDDPVIDGPESWKSDFRARFAEIPEDMREYIVQRDIESKSALNRQITQAAEARKTYEVEFAKANQEKTQQAQLLQTMLVMSLPELQQLQNVNWDELSRTNPGEWARLKQTQEGATQRFNHAYQQLTSLQQQQLQQQQGQVAVRAKESYERLIADNPDFGDPDKAKQRATRIATMMHERGFSSEEVNSINDARVITMLDEFAAFKEAEKARKSANTKKTAQPAPKVLGKTAAPTQDRQKGNKTTEDFQRLVRSNTSMDKRHKMSKSQQEQVASRLFSELL